VGLHRSEDRSEARRFSTVEVDERGRITFFKEKAEEARSELVAICLYLFERSCVGLLKEYLEGGGMRDARGYYVEWLYRRVAVYGKVMEGRWYDIGDERSYREANSALGGREGVDMGDGGG
jgi:glucose-1-phosphate thymidylyltransferase